MNQFLALTRLELTNLFGLNVYRHEKDPANKKRKTLLMAAIIFAVAVLAVYLSFSAYALAVLGAGDKIPTLYSLLASVFLLFFGLLKAKSALFREKDLTFLASLPLRNTPIAASRLIHLYVENATVGAVILLPAFLIRGITGHAGAAFWGNTALALLIVPVLPTALTAWFGLLTTAVVARNRHKVLTETMLMVIMVVVVFLLPLFLLPDIGRAPSNAFVLPAGTDEETLRAMSEQVTAAFEGMERSVPFLKTWGSFFSGGNMIGLLAYGLFSMAVSILTAILIGRYFFALSARLFPASAHREFQMAGMRQNTVLRSLVMKEAKRYFSSGLYVSNTIVNPLLAVFFALSLGFIDLSSLLSGAEALPVQLNLRAAVPFLLGMIFAMMTPAASSVSLEGKNWWITRSLPLSSGDVCHAKLLFSLLVAAPFYGAAEIILLFTVRANWLERLWLLLAPAALIGFAHTFGLLISLKHPNFTWESEVQVIKQSAAVGLSMLAALAGLLPAMALMVLPEGPAHFAAAGFILLIGLITYWMHQKILKFKLP